MVQSNHPADVGSLLTSVLTKKDWLQRLKLHQVFLFWNEVVGKEIARHAQPQVIKGDTLWLAVSDAIWMQQLQFERHHLLELINFRLAERGAQERATTGEGKDAPRLNEIKFALDTSIGRRPAKAKRAAVREIDHEQFAQFSASLNSIEDQATRESMKRLWLVMHQRAE